MKADLILTDGRIYTLNPKQPWSEAIAIRGRRILALGNSADMMAIRGPGTRHLSLGGRLVLPGLCDAHIHLYDWSLSRKQVNLTGCRNKSEMLSRIERWRASMEGWGWIIGRGWNETGWPDPALPGREELDRIAGDRPALLWRSDMHCAVVNSLALEIAGIDTSTPDPEGGLIGRDALGRPNGLLWELAINQVYTQVPPPEPGVVVEAIASAIGELNRLGVTALHDQRMKDQPEGPVALAAYQRLRGEDRLDMRINCNIAAHNLPYVQYLGVQSGFGDDKLRLGHIKFFADGTIGSRTAWMLSDFADQDTAGTCVTDPSELARDMHQAVALGFPVSVHAIGDRANREVLDVLEEVILRGPATRVPHRIEHVQVIDPADLPRLAASGITASVQPVHVLDDMVMTPEAIGQRASQAYNFRDLLDSGALMALGSDAPVSDPNPWLGIHAAITRGTAADGSPESWNPSQRITLEEALVGYTLGAARAAGWERDIGNIMPGKLADLIVLDRDIFDLSDEEIRDGALLRTKVLMTIFDGRLIHDQLN